MYPEVPLAGGCRAHEREHAEKIDDSAQRRVAKVRTRTYDTANYLRDEQDMSGYLEAALTGGDAAVIAAALGDIARARGMTQLARDTGLGRESLYKALSPGGNPESARF